MKPINKNHQPKAKPKPGHKPVNGKAPHLVPHKPAAGKPQRKPANRKAPHKPAAVKPKPHPVKGAAGAGFHDFKHGIMMNDGKGRLDDRNDWLESIPTKSGNHIAAYYLIVPYKEWVYNFQHDCTASSDFMGWLFSEFVPREEARERLYPFELVQPGLTRREMLNGIKNKRVKYLGKEQRKEKIIKVDKNGLLVDRRGRAYHTGIESTMHSGAGWAIFVMDKNNTIYAGSHIAGEFHHSSFLGGNYVSSAGEIAVRNGKLVAITCRSGHYRPDPKNMIYFLNSLNDRKVNLKNVPIQLNEGPPRFCDAFEALKNNGRYARTLPAPIRVF